MAERLSLQNMCVLWFFPTRHFVFVFVLLHLNIFLLIIFKNVCNTLIGVKMSSTARCMTMDDWIFKIHWECAWCLKNSVRFLQNSARNNQSMIWKKFNPVKKIHWWRPSDGLTLSVCGSGQISRKIGYRSGFLEWKIVILEFWRWLMINRFYSFMTSSKMLSQWYSYAAFTQVLRKWRKDASKKCVYCCIYVRCIFIFQ